MKHLKKYTDYIRNTGQVPLPCTDFDDDWDPVGPVARYSLVSEGLITETNEGLTLTDKASMPESS